MTLTAWRRHFQASLQAWADFLWPPSPDRVRQEQDAAVSAELHRRQRRCSASGCAWNAGKASWGPWLAKSSN